MKVKKHSYSRVSIMVKRWPRHIKRFPRKMSRDFTSEELKDATRKNGSVDLNKIRNAIDRRTQERKEKVQKALETRKEHGEMFTAFMNMYKKYMNAEFIPNTKARFISYNQNGKRIIRRHKTDRARFVDFYIKVKKKYGDEYWSDKWIKYVDRVFYLALEEYGFSKQNKIFGLFISDKIVDKVFTDIRREERRKQRKVERLKQKDRHIRLFNNE